MSLICCVFNFRTIKIFQRASGVNQFRSAWTSKNNYLLISKWLLGNSGLHCETLQAIATVRVAKTFKQPARAVKKLRHTTLTTNKRSLISDWLSLFQISRFNGNMRYLGPSALWFARFISNFCWLRHHGRKRERLMSNTLIGQVYFNFCPYMVLLTVYSATSLTSTKTLKNQKYTTIWKKKEEFLPFPFLILEEVWTLKCCNPF